MATPERKNEQTLTIQQLKYLRAVERNKHTQLMRRKRLATRLMNENKIVRESLKELAHGNKDSIIPLGAGIYVQGSISPQSFKRTLPGNVVLNASHEEIEKELTEREKLYTQDLSVVEKELLETHKNIQGMNAVLQMSRKKGKQ